MWLHSCINHHTPREHVSALLLHVSEPVPPSRHTCKHDHIDESGTSIRAEARALSPARPWRRRLSARVMRPAAAVDAGALAAAPSSPLAAHVHTDVLNRWQRNCTPADAAIELLHTRACQPSDADLPVHMHIVRCTDSADQALHTRMRQLWRATLSPESYMSIP